MSRFAQRYAPKQGGKPRPVTPHLSLWQYITCQLPSHINTVVICTMFFTYPSIVEALVQLFTCTSIDGSEAGVLNPLAVSENGNDLNWQ